MDPIEIEEMQLPSNTYLVRNGRILSQVDGHEAMRQAVEKALSTPRYCVPWLSSNYGHDLNDLLGKPMEYAEMEVERMLKETFASDDRVEDVELIRLERVDKSSLLAVASVLTMYGEFTNDMEVALNDTQ
ncbi:DUF2634 domain-containing protein [Weissella tructae]